MESARIRRLCGVFALLAFLLPILPAAIGPPVVGAGHCGNASRYGDAECLPLSFGLMLLALVGIVATQASLGRAARRAALPKAMVVAFLYLLVLPAALGIS